MQNLIDSLAGDLEAAQAVKSSHWKYHAEKGDGFGVLKQSGGMAGAWHWAAQRGLYFGQRDIFSTEEYNQMRDWCQAQGRVLNQNSLLHVFAIRFLHQRLSPVPITCVVGDGQANFAGLWLRMSLPTQKLISINLPEVLIADVSPLVRSGVVSAEQMAVAKTRDELDAALRNDAIQLVMVSANRAEIVKDAGIGLFVNIASFQEMTQQIVDQYFEIVKSNRAWLYCCNREEKTLYGGERIEFKNYAWGDGAQDVFEECPWYTSYYSSRPPFLAKFDGKTLHALVKYA
ncbi:hypothetical protein ABIB57_003621 [Devosia sp. UYZn731]|uniref:hypothetical protein n=1 Tax=Devosia sp. UYZn731 TaxID=3156345 RepID=UPI003393822B